MDTRNRGKTSHSQISEKLAGLGISGRRGRQPEAPAFCALESEPSWVLSWRPYLWIALAIVICHGKALLYDFTYLDDNALVIDNYLFNNDIRNIVHAFGNDVFLSNAGQAFFRPVLTISFILDAQFGGLKPLAYHLDNLVLHLVASSLLFTFLNRLKYRRDLAFFFSVFFACHPLLTQAVAWVPGRNDSLLAVFVLLSLVTLIDFTEKPSLGTLFGHTFFFALALFTKESALAIILLGTYFFLLIKRERLLSQKAVYLGCSWGAIGVLWMILRHLALKHPLETSTFEIFHSLWRSLPAIVQYIGKVFVPINLSVLADIDDTSLVFGGVATFALAALMWSARGRPKRHLYLGVLWFFAFLVPTLIRPNRDLDPVLYALEHRMYTPMIGILIILLEFPFRHHFTLSRRWYLAGGSAVILLWGALTFAHSSNFRNRLVFWESAVETSPSHPLAHRNLGAMYYLENRLDDAEREFKKSIEINPVEPMAHSNLALVYARKNMPKEAEEMYKKEIELRPLCDVAYLNLGFLYYNYGNKDAAAQLWEHVIEINPNYIDAYKALLAFALERKDLGRVTLYADELKRRGIAVPSLP